MLDYGIYSLCRGRKLSRSLLFPSGGTGPAAAAAGGGHRRPGGFIIMVAGSLLVKDLLRKSWCSCTGRFLVSFRYLYVVVLVVVILGS